MGKAREGVKVPPRALVLLNVVAERTNHDPKKTGKKCAPATRHVDCISRPGSELLTRDLAWSEDTIGRAVAEAVALGAVKVTGGYRGHALEFRFTEAVRLAPNLDVFAAIDKGKPKGPQVCGAFGAGKGPQNGAERSALLPAKPRRVADPTVMYRERTERTPPLPPSPADAGAGGADPRSTERVFQEERERKRKAQALAIQAATYIQSKGALAGRRTRRQLFDWAHAGLSLEELQERIDRGDHLPRIRW
jgi:hypothetical protein